MVNGAKDGTRESIMRAPSCRGIDLARLVGTAYPSEFFDANWERAPRLALGTLSGALDDILTLEQFEVFVAGVPAGLSIVDRHVARPVTGAESDLVRQPLVYEAYCSGCTVLLRGLQLRSTSIAEICRALENEVLRRGIPLAECVSANGYLTPVRSRGFDLHYDDHCAFILQVHGTKDWSVFAPTEELPVARCERAIARDDLGAPLIERTLVPGDVLYIPRGFPHFASTGRTSSLHVTFSLRTVTWAELIMAMCHDIAVFRRSVAPGNRHAPSAQEYFEAELMPRFRELHIDPFLKRRVAECLTQLGPVPGARLREIDETDQIDSDTVVARVPQVVCGVSEEGGSAVLRFPGAALPLPAAMAPVFGFIASHDEFAVRELPALDGQYDAVALTRILVRRGLLYRRGPAAGAPSATTPEVLARHA